MTTTTTSPDGLPEPNCPFPPIDIAAETAAGLSFLTGCGHSDIECFAPIGSATYMADAADVDFAVLLWPGCDAMSYAEELTRREGFRHCGEYDSKNGTWCAVRRGNLNLMLTHDRAFYTGYLRATEVCKRLNLQSKADRIAVCQIVRDGLSAAESFR
jgi:hypothetical protein